MTHPTDLLGEWVRVGSLADPASTLAEGELIGYGEDPSITVRRADGSQVSMSARCPVSLVPRPFVPERVDLRRRYRDPVSGYEGVAMARTEFAFSSTSVKLSRGSKDGVPEEQWFPEAQVEPVGDDLAGPSGLGFARSDP